MINTANDVGNFFSSFRRLAEEAKEEEQDAGWLWPLLSGGAQSNLPRRLEQAHAELVAAAARFPSPSDLRRAEAAARRRRLGAQDTCRNTQQDAEDLKADVDQGKEDSLSSIANSQREVSDAINNAEYQVSQATNAAEARIRDSVKSGRNQMIEAFEMTRGICNSIRANMGDIRNTTETVFDYMATGCGMVVDMMAEPPGNADGAYAAVQDMMVKLQQPIELTIGLTHAFMVRSSRYTLAHSRQPRAHACPSC